LAWCPKYRKKVLVGRVEAGLRELLYEKAESLGVEIEALEITPVLPGTGAQGKCAAGASVPDHVHMFVSADPTEAPQRLANQFKGHTSRILRQAFSSLRSRLSTLWSRSYYAGSVGNISEDSVKKYCESENEGVV